MQLLSWLLAERYSVVEVLATLVIGALPLYIVSDIIVAGFTSVTGIKVRYNNEQKDNQDR